MDTKKIRVVLVDDHHIMREGLKALLEGRSDISVVGEAGNGRDALSLIRKTGADVVVMDVSMPDMNGIEATRQIKEEFSDIRVIALSMHSDKLFVEGMLKAGVSVDICSRTACWRIWPMPSTRW